jgi:hypothetical protein
MKRLAQFARDYKIDGWDCTRQIIPFSSALCLFIFTSVQYTLVLFYSPFSFQHLPYSLLSMPRPEPHPLALFSLKPHNPRTHDAVAHPNNSHLVSILPDANGALTLDFGFNIRS